MPRLIEALSDFLPEKDCVIIVLVEHLGDILACEPVIRYARRTWPGKAIAWIAQRHFCGVLMGHPDLDYVVQADSVVEAIAWADNFRSRCRVLNLHFCGHKCGGTGQSAQSSAGSAITALNYYDYGGLLEAFSMVAGLPRLDDAPNYYIPPMQERPDVPESYVVVHCRSNCDGRDWRREYWLQLVDFFASRNLHVLEIGMEPAIASDSPFYHDMTRLYSLAQIAAIMQQARFFVGIDSAFAHLANALRIDGVVILGAFGYWEKYNPYTGFYRNGKIISPSEGLPARFVSPDAVKEACSRALSGEKIVQEEVQPVRIDSSFPNAIQSFIIRKLYRPLVKRLAGREYYELLVEFPGLYFRMQHSPEPFRAFFDRILRLFGKGVMRES